MVRSDLLEKLPQAHPYLLRQVVEPALDAMLNEITAGLVQGHRVKLQKFRNFTCRGSEAGMGRNPRTGKAVFMQSRPIPRFRACGHILERPNRPTTPG